MSINYLAIFVASILSMVTGAIWYGPLFGKKWLEIIGANKLDKAAREQMKKESSKLYLIQFVLTLFQVYVLSFFITTISEYSGVVTALWIWAAFVIPTVAGAAMWNNDPKKVQWARFLIQGGYQLVIFIIFGLVLSYLG